MAPPPDLLSQIQAGRARRAARRSGLPVEQAEAESLPLPSEIIKSKASSQAEDALRAANAKETRDYNEKMREIPDAKVRQRIRGQTEYPLRELQSVRKGAGGARRDAAKAGDTETAERIGEAQQAARKGEQPSGGWADTAKSAGRGVLKVIDAPHHLVRQATTKYLGDNEHGLYDRDISAEEWTENVRKTEKAGGLKGAAASAALALPRVFGAVVGAPVGATIGAIGAVSDIPGLVRGERTAGDVARNFATTVDETVKDTTDLGLTMETDPTSYVSVGVGGAAKAAGGAAMRTGLKSGLPRVAAELLGTKVGKLAGAIANEPKAFEAVEKTFAKHFARAGLSEEAGKKAAREAFGEVGEFFGRGQAELHLPFMSGKGVPIAPKLGLGEYAGAKAVKKVADPILEKFGGRKLLDPTKNAVKMVQREARGIQSMREGEMMTDLSEKFGQLPEGHRLSDPAVRRAIEMRHADPGWVETAIDVDNLPVEEARKLVSEVGERRIVQRGDGKWYRLDPKEDYVPAEKLDEVFGPGAKQYVEGLNKWHSAAADQLIETGALKQSQLAKNPISGLYRKRVFEPKYRGLEATVQSNRNAMKASNSFSKRAQQGYLSPEYAETSGLARREADYLKVAPAYAKQAARAEAQKHLEKRLLDAFATDGRTGGKLNIVMKELEDGRKVPADVYNAIHGTFDQSLRTIGSAMRQAGAASTPAGRAALAVADAMGAMSSRFKGLVLKTPAYHAVNIYDDTIKMALAGMHNPMKYIGKANRIIRDGVVEVGGKKVSLSSANRHNIGVAAAQRFEQTGQRASEKRLARALQDSSGKVTVGQRAGRAYDAVNEFSNHIGEGWENRAKLAHYLWRIDQGDSPALAAKKTFDVLIDYGDRNRAEHVASWFVPFMKYAKEAPGVVGRLAVKNPGALNALDRSLTFLGGEGHEPPGHVQERTSHYVQLTPRGKEVAGNFRQMFGGAPSREGLSMGFVPRLAPFDAFAPVAALADKNIDPLMMQMGPGIQAINELWTGRDLLTKQELAPPDSFFDWFPAGTPVVPQWMQADVGENPWASRYAAPYLASPGTLTAANQMVNQSQQGKGNVSTFGRARPYSPLSDPADTYAMQWMKYLSGVPTYETTPGDRIKNLADLPSVKAFNRNVEGGKKQAKRERRGR